MKVLVRGSTTFGNLPKKAPPYELKDGSYCGVDRDDPSFSNKLEEYLVVKSVLEKFAKEHSTCYLPDDNWLPGDIEIITLKQEGVCEAAIEWAIVNWCKYTEYKSLLDITEAIDFHLMIWDKDNVIIADETGRIIN